MVPVFLRAEVTQMHAHDAEAEGEPFGREDRHQQDGGGLRGRGGGPNVSNTRCCYNENVITEPLICTLTKPIFFFKAQSYPNINKTKEKLGCFCLSETKGNKNEKTERCKNLSGREGC